MNTIFAQLAKWPPTTSTVIGVGFILGGLDYLFTGSVTQTVFVMGIFKVLCPEDGNAADQAAKIINQLPKGAA